MDDEIDLRDIFQILWKMRLLIIGVFAVAVLLAGVISFVMPPVYKVSSIITGGNFDDPVYTSQASMKNVMISDGFALKVFEQISPNATESEFQDFKNGIKVEPVYGSDTLIEISIETKKKREGLKAVEMMIQLYTNLSEDSYNKHKNILTDQLAVAQERLDVINMEMNQTRDALQRLQESSDSSAVQGEMQFSRTLDRLNGMETYRTSLINLKQDLKNQLLLIRNIEVVQPPREPVSPIWPRKALIVAIGGVLGLVIGIFAAFLRDWLLGRPAK